MQFFAEALVWRKQKTGFPVKIGKQAVWKRTGNGLVSVDPAGGGWWCALAEMSQMRNGIEMVKKR